MVSNDKKTKPTKHKVKKKREKIVDVHSNVVRQISNQLNKTFDIQKLKGSFYFNIHLYLIFVIGFITFFTTSVNVLIIVLIIVSLDAVSIVFLHECPLTTMEKKYLGITSCELRNEFLKKKGIMYTCDHDYEKQIELLINVWTIIASKCLSIIFLKMFNIQLFDVGQIYS
jgi:TM2 domain-containing membrane protein YozV